MKVLHLVQGYYPAIGGTEFLIKNISERLAADYGDEVSVITTNAYNTDAFTNRRAQVMAPGEETINGVRVNRLAVINGLAPVLGGAQSVAYRLRLPYNDWLRTLYGGPLLRGIFAAMRDVEVDVVAASSFPLMHMYYADRISRKKNIPLVLHGGLHPEDVWGFDRDNMLSVIRRANAYIANTTYEKKYLVEQGIDKDKIHVVGVGTEVEVFAAADGRRFRRSIGLDAQPLLAFVGQQGGHKGIETIIQAMPFVWRQVPEARLVIAGARTAYSQIIDEMIAGLPGESRGKVTTLSNFTESEKADILAACDVFVSPSGFESFGITYLEAWSCAKPVIGTRSGAIPSVIAEGKDGLLVDYKDYRELAGAILELLSDEAVRLAMGDNGRRKVLAKYTWSKVAAKFRSVYAQVA